MKSVRKAVGRASEQRKAKQAPARKRTGTALNLDALPSILGFHVRLANVVIFRDFMDTVQSLDMTQRQSAVLILIGTNPGSSQIVLADFLGTDRATMMAMIDRLESRGLIERRQVAKDRRVRALFLTDDGLAMLSELKRRIVRHEKKFLNRFTGQELKQFFEYLSRVHQKL